MDPQQCLSASRPQRLDAGTRLIEILCVARLAAGERRSRHPVPGGGRRIVRAHGHDVRITVAGDGPLRTELIRLAEVLGIQTHVRFLGSVGQDVIHFALAAPRWTFSFCPVLPRASRLC